MSVRMKTEDGDIILSGKGKDGKDGTSGIPVPQVAEIGQILAVKAVDDDGKPTEWETVDKSNGGINVTVLKENINVSSTNVAMGFNPSSTNLKFIVITGSLLIPLIIPVSLFTRNAYSCWAGFYASYSATIAPATVTLTTNGEIRITGYSSLNISIYGIS